MQQDASIRIHIKYIASFLCYESQPRNMTRCIEYVGASQRRRSTPSPLPVGVTILDENVTFSRPPRSAGLTIPPFHNSAPTSPITHRNAFRNTPSSSPRRRASVACQRCRTLKARCDENWPQCTNCKRANTECVKLLLTCDATKNYIESLERRCNGLQRRLDMLLDKTASSETQQNQGYCTEPVTTAQMTSYNGIQSILTRSTWPIPEHSDLDSSWPSLDMTSALGNLGIGADDSCNTPTLLPQASSRELTDTSNVWTYEHLLGIVHATGNRNSTNDLTDQYPIFVQHNCLPS